MILCTSIVVTAIAAVLVGIVRYSTLQGEQRSAADGLLIVSIVVAVGGLITAAVIFRALRPRV